MEAMKNKAKIKPKKQRKSPFSCPTVGETCRNSLSIALTFKGLATKIFSVDFQGTHGSLKTQH